ncbi:MAG: type II secretion system protein [Clostridia bacterium]|nr:type II secretion system protein [Clostridia bacterium]
MKQTKKGFTLVELLVVIAILAILATVSVVGYTAFIQKAHESNDIQFLQSLNTLIIACDDINTPHDAFDFVRREGGVDLGKFHSKIEGCEILWDSHNEKFCYLNKEGELVYVPGTLPEGNTPANHELWMVCDTAEDANNCPYSIYYAGEDGATITTTNSFDGGWATGLTVNYEGTLEVAIIRMVDGAKLTISDTTDSHQQYFYGSVAHAEISTGNNCFHAHGDIDYVELKAGTFMQEEGTTTAIVMGANTTVNVIAGGSISAEYDAAEVAGKEEQIQTGATKFAGGMGTEENPYLIANAEQFENIGTEYETYNYYKVAHGVETLDLAGVGAIKLHGSFDGNDVKINNRTTALFQQVGYNNQSEEIVISNMDVTFNSTDGRALVRNIYNPGKTTFQNVHLHGYIEGQYNMGSFYNYGTANHGDSDGADYTVEFINSTSDITLVCTTGNAIGGMLGHGYEGADYELSIIMDASSCYTGKMYTTGTATCYQVMAMCSHATYNLNGVETSRYENTYPSTKLAVSTPVAGNDGYTVEVAEDASYFVVTLNAQVTAYDKNGIKIDNKAGMTWVLGSQKIDKTEGKVFDLVTSATIVNDTDHDMGYELKNGVMTVYSGRTDNYCTGWITLQVVQYDVTGNIVAVGIVNVYTFPEV